MIQVDDRRSTLEKHDLAPWNAHLPTIECVIRTMREHLCESFSLEDMADVACLSPYYFSRVFHQIIGTPPGEFLATLRLDMAKRLLLTTPMSVTDICFEVGYTSMGSFTSRFTQMVGLSPRLLRQRAHRFEPLPLEQIEHRPPPSPCTLLKNALWGQISAPATFRGTIYVGLFTSSIPQGKPVRCTRLGSPGLYLLHGMADRVYHLRAAAFPASSDLQSSLLPGEKMLLGNNARPLVIHNGHVSGNPDLVLHPPHLTDPPLVMGLPLL